MSKFLKLKQAIGCIMVLAAWVTGLFLVLHADPLEAIPGGIGGAVVVVISCIAAIGVGMWLILDIR